MIDEILRNNLIIREWLNGGLLPLNLSLVIVTGLFLWDSWREPHFGRRWQDVAGVKTACVLLWIFGSDALRAGLVWDLLWTAPRVPLPNVAGVTTAMVLVNFGFIVAGLVGLIATMRCIYIFTPPKWGHRYWLGAAAATFAFQIVTHLIRGA